jgi:pimeloyl-ACP methyl ester carboxylesterase
LGILLGRQPHAVPRRGSDFVQNQLIMSTLVRFFEKTLRVIFYFFLLFLVSWSVAVQAGCFAMRTPDAGWPQKLQNKGQVHLPRFLDAPLPDGRRVHGVALAVADSLPLVVLVHGSPGASDAYLDYLADTVLTRRARLVSLDRLGFGYSDFGRPEPSLAAQAAAVQTIVNQLEPNQKVLLVGHSLGGPVICRFAMDYPERTAGLVIVAGSIDPAQEEHPWWQAVVDAPPVKWLTPKPLWASNAEIIPLEKELEAMLPLWPRIACPVRVLHATNDRLVPVANAAFARQMLTQCPDLKVEIFPEGDHFILWNHYADVRAAILELLEG